MRYFETEFLDEAKKFLKTLQPKIVKKVFYNIDLAEQTNDPKLFKKLKSDIWEFQNNYAGLQIRVLPVQGKTENKKTLLIGTRGFIKKVDKVPTKEINRAIRLKDKYFETN